MPPPTIADTTARHRLAFKVVGLEELDAGDDSGNVFARQIELLAGVGSGCDEDGFVAVLEQLVDRKVAAQSLPETHLDVLIHQGRDFPLQAFARQAIFRDCSRQHPAGHPFALKHRDAVPEDGQRIGGGQAGRARRR